MLLRKFSFFFQAFALIPLLVLVYLYSHYDERAGMGVSREQLGWVICLLGVVLLLGFFGMRRLLARISELSTTVQNVLAGKDKQTAVSQMLKGEGEVAELARSFATIIEELEANIKELERTKGTLQRTLARVADAASKTEDTNLLCRLILDTATEAIAAREGAIFHYDGREFGLDLWTPSSEQDPAQLLDSARPLLKRLAADQGLIVEPEGAAATDPSPAGTAGTSLSAATICCALTFRGRMRGALLMSGKRFRPDFSSDDVSLVANLAHQVAALLENAELNAEREQTYFETMAALVQAVEARDKYSRGHSERVGAYALEIGRTLGLTPGDLQDLSGASKLHDIGKIGIADRILLKPEPLSHLEIEVMKRHPIIGENIVRPLRTFRGLLHPIRHHHEFLDGSGYPDGLKGDEIPTITRIMVVADIFDALTTDRPYRAAMEATEAIHVLDRMETAGKVSHLCVNALRQVVIGEGFVPLSPEPHPIEARP